MAEGDDIREEAERLVSAALAAASYALRGVGRDSPLAGLAERVLSPEFAFRVAVGANDIASGVASILRAFQPAPPRREPPPKPRDPGPTWRAATDHPPVPVEEDDDPWQAATRGAPPPDGESD
jgi:hypothetical protein